ncbi:BRCT domain-containing protein [Rahnella aceris]|uniref:BRCT domain-containing protein n=1 Tax=Rahnella sp. (strain Y9602) TaxID=2703885 RepID=UPI001C27D27D|nr:hypothetical protein [Rahnella aceris]MBU9849693.1 hypothetical protein [Rahnella aceris]
MEEIYFVYVTAKNKISAYSLVNACGNDEYLHGFCTTRGHYRTFKEERVIKYFSSYEKAEQFATEMAALPLPEFGFKESGVLHVRKKNYKRYESPGMFTPLDFTGPLEICFTGFKKEDKERLSALAKEAGMIIRKDITVNLHFLCGGYNAGPKKLEVAHKKGTMILHESEFVSLVQTGELPDDYDN